MNSMKLGQRVTRRKSDKDQSRNNLINSFSEPSGSLKPVRISGFRNFEITTGICNAS